MNRHFVGREDREGQRRERRPRSAGHNDPAAPGRGRPGDSKRVREAEVLSVSGRAGDDGSPARARGTDAVSRESEGSPSCDSGRTEPDAGREDAAGTLQVATLLQAGGRSGERSSWLTGTPAHHGVLSLGFAISS